MGRLLVSRQATQPAAKGRIQPLNVGRGDHSSRARGYQHHADASERVMHPTLRHACDVMLGRVFHDLGQLEVCCQHQPRTLAPSAPACVAEGGREGAGIARQAIDTHQDGSVRRQLKTAAGDLGMALEFRPIKTKNRMHIRVVTLEEKAANPYRGGKSKKVEPEALQETTSSG